MSTEAPATPAKKSVPLYKRRRRRLYGAAALVLAVIVGVVVWATTGGSGSGPLPSFTISVSQGSVASPDSIIESQPSLAKLIPAKLKYVPFEAGVTAIAEMKSGSVQAISGVGNPPVTEAIGSGTGVTVVMGWGFDDDQLLVPASVASPAQLAGKSIGVLVGSSEDYELLGYLALQHLTGKVKVVPFSDENAAGAAAVRGGRRRLRLRQPGYRAAQEGRPRAGQRPADRQAGRPRA
jgi:ABC-type nitrate/sulfonate/bicarbonate transport system substrate-binding protein